MIQLQMWRFVRRFGYGDGYGDEHGYLYLYHGPSRDQIECHGLLASARWADKPSTAMAALQSAVGKWVTS